MNGKITTKVYNVNIIIDSQEQLAYIKLILCCIGSELCTQIEKLKSPPIYGSVIPLRGIVAASSKKPSKLYGYEKTDHRGNPVYPMCPVQCKLGIVAVYVVGNGYVPVSFQTYETDEECWRACTTHNKYHGWNQEEVEEIVTKSMMGKY